MARNVRICPVCQSAKTDQFLHRPAVAVHQNMVVADAAAARHSPRGELALRCCRSCGFVYNAAFAFELLRYGAEYDNRQDCSAVFEAHVDELARDLLDRCAVRNCRIIEVGCGDGSFLRRLVADPAAGNTGYGFDPSYVGPASDLDGRLRFASRYFDATCADLEADVVLCRHVIEHVPDPLSLLASVRSALKGSTPALAFFETPCVRWIFEHEVIWDFFYEHCSLFSVESMTTAFEAAGFAVDNICNVFGGQYLWLKSRVAEGEIDAVLSAAGEVPALARAFAQTESRQCKQWRQRLRDSAQAGPIALWGAGAKGATFADLVDPDCTEIDCLVDINPNKQGKFLPGTGHPIVAPAELARRGIATIMILNPNYRAEIQRTIAAADLDIALVDMMAPIE